MKINNSRKKLIVLPKIICFINLLNGFLSVMLANNWKVIITTIAAEIPSIRAALPPNFHNSRRVRVLLIVIETQWTSNIANFDYVHDFRQKQVKYNF